MGSSLLVLTASNTYSGRTTIAGGTLQIGSGGTAGSIGGSSGILDNGLLVFDVASPATISNISGSGGLTLATGYRSRWRQRQLQRPDHDQRRHPPGGQPVEQRRQLGRRVGHGDQQRRDAGPEWRTGDHRRAEPAPGR